MRHAFCRALTEFASRPDFVFLTGDLGFQALEPLRDAMGDRFINAGVAEQNMVAVAAGLARCGFRPWLYSIAPFLYARALEQIRNDLCLPGYPVVLAGNGGGYGYGVMGSTHHALEDYGVLLTLQSMRVYIPAFDGDVSEAVALAMNSSSPTYLRLGLSEQPAWLSPPPFSAWRRILPGNGATVAIAGPLAGGIVDAIRDAGVDADIWLVSELPVRIIPPQFLAGLRRSGVLFIVEEHVAAGGFGQMLCHALMAAGESPKRVVHRCALGYVSGRYGSQRFHRAESGLDPASIVAELTGAAES